jgi:GNAT superfamily N-acetyltransferase
VAKWTRFKTVQPDDERPARQLVLVEAGSAAELSDWQKLPSKHCVCLVIWDAPEDERELKKVVKRLLAAGAVYVCTFGEGCERLEQAVDRLSAVPGDDDVIMTGSYPDEPLDEALWFALFCASPAAAYEATTMTTLIVSIGAPQHAHALHRALSDPERFSERYLVQQPKGNHPTLKDVDALKVADSWWARDFACSPGALRPRHTHVQQHAGQLLGNPGIWMLVAGASPLVSLPPELMPELADLARAWTTADVADPSSLVWPISDRCRRQVERVVGPAFIGYWTLDVLGSESESVARQVASPEAILRLQAACDPLEWRHGGGDATSAVHFGIVEPSGELSALAGYQVWNESIAHLHVVTHPRHRGRGLGRAVVAAAAEHAFDAGLLPQYRTLRENAPSMAIARQLGFLDYGSSVYIGLSS